jgi:hypothetical protein
LRSLMRFISAIKWYVKWLNFDFSIYSTFCVISFNFTARPPKYKTRESNLINFNFHRELYSCNDTHNFFGGVRSQRMSLDFMFMVLLCVCGLSGAWNSAHCLVISFLWCYCHSSVCFPEMSTSYGSDVEKNCRMMWKCERDSLRREEARPGCLYLERKKGIL